MSDEKPIIEGRADELLEDSRRALASAVMGVGLDGLTLRTRKAIGNALIYAARAEPSDEMFVDYRRAVAVLLRLLEEDSQ